MLVGCYANHKCMEHYPEYNTIRQQCISIPLISQAPASLESSSIGKIEIEDTELINILLYFIINILIASIGGKKDNCNERSTFDYFCISVLHLRGLSYYIRPTRNGWLVKWNGIIAWKCLTSKQSIYIVGQLHATVCYMVNTGFIVDNLSTYTQTNLLYSILIYSLLTLM